MSNVVPDQTTASGGSLGSLIAQLSGVIASEQFPSGDRAALKRMDPEREPPLSFYRFAFRHLPESWSAQRRSWQTLLSGMALMSPQIHRVDLPLGRALAENRFSEARLERLLAADGEVKQTLLLRAVRFLAAKKVAVNWLDIAQLLLTQESDKRQALQLRIARDFYRNQPTQE